MKTPSFLPYKHYLCLFTLICLTILVYLPGLKGGFIFDDYPNLEQLAQVAQSGTWQSIYDFSFSGGAGPTGRPLALLTFALQASSWPNAPIDFKIINLFIHISCGLLLYWASSSILISYGFDKKRSRWTALLACGCWLLHPLFVSTTLYTIQRMAQLPALFSLLGIIGYLQGRKILCQNPIISYCIMSLSIIFFTILATYSKENGALLPLLILIIEFCHPSLNNKPVWYWRGLFLWTPSLLILILLCRYIDFSSNPWPERNFNQIQRLMSEGRILCEYLFRLLFPQIEGNGLFQDGYIVSHGLLQPISTLISIGVIIFLIIFALVFKKSYPLVSLAILFFFSAQIIESTFINLELYFEHRNYISAMFLFLPICMGLVKLSDKISYKLISFTAVVILSILGFMTFERSTLWSNTDRLKIYWAQHNLNSNRAQINYAEVLWKHGYYTEANQVLEHALKHGSKVAIGLQLLNQKVQLGSATQQDINDIQQKLTTQKIDGDVTWRLRWLVQTIVNDPKATQRYAHGILHVLQVVAKGNYAVNPDFSALNMFLQGQLYGALNEQQSAYFCYKISAFSYNDVNSALAVVADFANRGDKIFALKLLFDVEQHYKKQLVDNIAMQKAAARLRETIQNDIQSEKG